MAMKQLPRYLTDDARSAKYARWLGNQARYPYLEGITGWLEDSTLHSFCSAVTNGRRGYFAFSVYWDPPLMLGHETETEGAQSLKRFYQWSRKKRPELDEDMFANKVLLFPFLFERNTWALMWLNVETKQLFVADCTNRARAETPEVKVLEMVIRKAYDLHRRSSLCDLVVLPPEVVPQENKSGNCGVLVCAFVFTLVFAQNLKQVKEEDNKRLRLRIFETVRDGVLRIGEEKAKAKARSSEEDQEGAHKRGQSNQQGQVGCSQKRQKKDAA